MVSFIVIPARKGFQAAAVTIADPAKKEEALQENEETFHDNETPLETAMEEMHVGQVNETTTDATNGEEMHAGEANETTTDATEGDWGSGGW